MDTQASQRRGSFDQDQGSMPNPPEVSNTKQGRAHFLRSPSLWVFVVLALVAIILCWLTKEPITALLGGIVAGAFLLGQYDLTDLGHDGAQCYVYRL